MSLKDRMNKAVGKKHYTQTMARNCGCTGKQCPDCKITFGKTTKVMCIEEQTGIFRGDDIVEFYCESCGNKRKET